MDFLNVILEQMIKYFLKYLNKEHRIIGHHHFLVELAGVVL